MPPRSSNRKKPSPATIPANSPATAEEEIKQDVIVKNEVAEKENEERESEIAGEEGGERMESGKSEVGEEAASIQGNHSPLESNSGKEVTVVAQTNGVEILGDDVNAPILETTSCGKGAVAAPVDGVKTCGDSINAPVLNDDDDMGEGEDIRSEMDQEKIIFDDDEDPEEVSDSHENDEDENAHKEHPLMVSNSVISDKKKEKNVVVFVSRLDKKIVEEDLVEVFGKFGEIQSARIVRNKATNKSKGFAFLKYASNEEAESAISASEGGIEVSGKQVKVSVSKADNNTTLYLGNICRTWTKERVLETLESLGIKNVENIRLPGAQKEGRTRGFAFLEFDTHSDAISAFQRLSKPDANFGRDECAKVSFSQTSVFPHEEVTSQVKTIYVEGLTEVWTEAKLREFCEQYGDVEEVRLSRTLGKKRKDYGHIDFASRESALACLEGFKNSPIEGVSMVKASIAKPLLKDRPQKQVPRGGVKVEKRRELSTINGESRANSKRAKGKGKGKMAAEEMRMTQVVPEAGGSGKSIENQIVVNNHLAQASTKTGKAKGKRKNLHMKAGSHGMSDFKRGPKGKTSENAQGKNQRNQNTSFGKQKRDNRAGKGSNFNADFGMYRSQYATGHAVPVRYEGHSYNTTAGSKRPYADMEPHAGYLEPVARKQGRAHSGLYEPPVAVHYSSHARSLYQPRGGHLEREVGIYHQTRTNYQNTPVQARYADSAHGTQAQPHAGYYQPAFRNSSEGLCGMTNIRGGRQDRHGIIPSPYREAPSIPPSYAQHYTSRVGYEAGSSDGGYYRRSGVQQPREGAYY